MTSRKYRSEFGLNIFGNFNCLLQQSDLCYLDQDDGFHAFKENPCHIYMICRRPRVTFEPGAFRITPEEIAGALRVHLGEKFERASFLMDNSKRMSCIRIDCHYPHNVARFLNESEGGYQIKAEDLARINGIFLDHLTLEVLYIGQSYGAEGARTAPQRLQNHSTLQGIYAEAVMNSPDKEI